MSHGGDLKSNMILVCWILPQALCHHWPYLSCRQDTIEKTKVCLYLGVYIYLLVVYRISSYTKDNRTWGEGFIQASICCSTFSDLCVCCPQEWRATDGQESTGLFRVSNEIPLAANQVDVIQSWYKKIHPVTRDSQL